MSELLLLSPMAYDTAIYLNASVPNILRPYIEKYYTVKTTVVDNELFDAKKRQQTDTNKFDALKK